MDNSFKIQLRDSCESEIEAEAGRAVAAALDDLPSDHPIAILEIGAGTGGTTSAVLPS